MIIIDSLSNEKNNFYYYKNNNKGKTCIKKNIFKNYDLKQIKTDLVSFENKILEESWIKKFNRSFINGKFDGRQRSRR